MARMNVSLPDSLYEDLKRLIPPRRRSGFIGAAVREKLERLQQVEAVERAAGAWSSSGRGEVEAELRDLREGWSARLEGGDGADSGNG